MVMSNLFYLDPKDNLDEPISACASLKEYIDVRAHIALFDGLVVPKEYEAPAAFGFGERGRRLVIFENEIDQNILSAKGMMFGNFAKPDRTIKEAGFDAVAGFGGNGDPRLLKNVILPKRYFKEEGCTSPGINIEFIDGISIAPNNTSLHDLLLFKERNAKEYIAFWTYLNLVVESIKLGHETNTNAMKSFLSAAEELERASQNTWGRRVVNSFNIDFDLGSNGFIFGEAAALTLEGYLNLPPAVFVVPLLGAIKFTGCLTPRKQELSKDARAISYFNMVRNLP